MKLLWLCNITPGAVQEKISGKSAGGLWLDHVLEDLMQRGLALRILCPGNGDKGDVNEISSFATFREGLPYEYLPELENRFCGELEAFHPDVIHIWGTEYGHTLAMVNAAERCGMISRVVINIQGMCSVIAKHYVEGVPSGIQGKSSFRDWVRKDNLLQQQRKFALRGELEIQALQKVQHVVGRTHWDRACTLRLNPDVTYHHCDETLRQPFYEGNWQYETCEKFNIFAPGSSYPVKGFHYLLEAFAEVVKTYPEATISLPGPDFPKKGDWRGKLRATAYQNYLQQLVHSFGLEDKVRFLGGLSAEQMKAAYLKANVFVIPSTIENSPNTLGEAMLLGVPCIASHVGGVATMLQHETEGFVYPSTAPYMLAHYIKQVFSMEGRAASLGAAAKRHAMQTHAPIKNQQALLDIYREIAK